MYYIGIFLEKETFRVAIAKKEKKTIAIEGMHAFTYGPDNVKLFYNLSPFHTGKQIHIVSGIKSSEIFIRKLHLPLRDRRKIFAAMPFQIESLIPFAEENPVICPLLQPLSKQMTSVTIISTLERSISSLLEELKSLDIVTDRISCSPIALMRFAKWQFPDENKILAFDVGDEKICCIVTEGKELLLSQTICINARDLIDFELEKLAIFLKQKEVIDAETPWLMTGDLSLGEKFAQVFSGKRLECDSALSSFTISIGLALDGLINDASSVQFCQKQFTLKHTLQNRKKKGLYYLGLCAAATILMSIGSTLILRKKQRLLVDQLQSYLTPSLASGSFSTLEEIEDKLDKWERSFKGQKSNFPFFPNIPKVSDVLAWLSTHSCFATEDGNQKEGIQIKSLHYNLTKYPKIDDPSAPYLAQVQLEFVSLAPRLARDFHEDLLKGDAIVNAKKEVKWQTNNQTYHTAFELTRGAAQ